MVLPRSGGYWCDDGSDTAAAPADPSQTASCKLELDETARCYRRFFVGKVSVTLNILFIFSPLDLNKRKQNEKVGDLCVRYSIVWGVLCYATASRVTDFTTAHGQLPRRVKGDSAPSPAGPGDFPFYLHPTAIIRVTQIYLFDTDKTATLLLCMHTQRKREFPRSIFFLLLPFVCVL